MHAFLEGIEMSFLVEFMLPFAWACRGGVILIFWRMVDTPGTLLTWQLWQYLPIFATFLVLYANG